MQCAAVRDDNHEEIQQPTATRYGKTAQRMQHLPEHCKLGVHSKGRTSGRSSAGTEPSQQGAQAPTNGKAEGRETSTKPPLPDVEDDRETKMAAEPQTGGATTRNGRGEPTTAGTETDVHTNRCEDNNTMPSPFFLFVKGRKSRRRLLYTNTHLSTVSTHGSRAKP